MTPATRPVAQAFCSGRGRSATWTRRTSGTGQHRFSGSEQRGDGGVGPSPDDQLWSEHPEMEGRVAEAEADFRAGRSTTTETLGEAQAHLDRLKRKR